VFTDDPGAVARELPQNGLDLIVAKMLKHLPHDDEIAGREWVGDRIDCPEREIVTNEHQLGHHVARGVCPGEVRPLPTRVIVLEILSPAPVVRRNPHRRVAQAGRPAGYFR